MISFNNDYSEGMCQPIIDNLIKTNYVQADGYGEDIFCKHAAKIIKKTVGHDDVDVHFVPGGTPANILAISLLKPYEAVICADTGHINVHETGSIESIGHKILTAKNVDGKLLPEDIEEIVNKHTDEHMVKPRMVFITNATELGTIYSKKELQDIRDICKKHNLYLYLDGARIGNAIMSKNNDLSLKDIADLTDMFYIGGTKNGALIGEAMIIKNNNLKENFRYYMKQNGFLLAKERIIGVSFITLFENNLYFKLADKANTMAQLLKVIFKQNGFELYVDSPTNQIFPILDNELIKKIKEKYIISDWCKYDDNKTVVRFVCSWATKKEFIKEFKDDIESYIKK